MGAIKRCGLFALASVLSLTACFTVFSDNTNAVSDYDNFLQPVTTLRLKSPNGSQELNVTTTVWDYITNALPTASNDCTSDDWQYIIDAPLNFVSQGYSIQTPTAGDVVYMGYSTNTEYPGAEFYKSGSNYYLYADFQAYDPTALGVYIRLDNSNGVRVECSNNLSSYVARSTRSGDEYTPYVSPFIAAMPVNYPSGYDGYTIPTWLTEDYAPRIKFFVDGLKITGMWCVDDELGDCNIPPVDAPLGLKWVVKDSDGEIVYQGTGPIDGNLLNFDIGHEFDTYGDYTLEGWWYVPVPYIKPGGQEWNTTSLTIRIDGSTYYSGTESQGCDDSGVCNEFAVSCDGISNFLLLATCKYNQALSVGVINPTINKFKQLMNSFVVPSTPSCSLPLSDISIAGKTFPVSTLGPSICAKTNHLHAAFPLASVIINFVFAILIFYLIAKIVNNLLDNQKHDVIITEVK